MSSYAGKFLAGLLFCLIADSAAAADIAVGATRAISTLAAAVAAAKAGDRILVDPGTYTDDTAKITVPLTIEGAGSGVVFHIASPIPNKKRIIVSDASLTVRNITFDGAYVSVSDGNNGAGIRAEAGDLTVDQCKFTNNQDGILVNPIPGATVKITGSTFTGNGAGDGQSHALYVGEVAQLTVSDSTFTGTKVGHDIKSRALKTNVSNTVLDDGVTGSASYAIDLSNGGVVSLDKLQITQGPYTQNATMVAYGAEGNLKASNSLSITNSTFINHLGSSSVIAVNNFTSTVSVTLTNNAFQNVPTILRGPGQVIGSGSPILLRAPAVYSSVQTAGKSYLRFYNTGAVAGTVTVLLYDLTSGDVLTQWTTPPIAPEASPQYGIDVIEAAANPKFTIPSFYALALQATIEGSFQHVLYNQGSGMLTNLSNCDTAAASGGALRLNNVHSSLVGEAFPSSIAVYNTAQEPATASLGVYDARDGSKLGTYPTVSIAALAGIILEMTAIEKAIGLTPGPKMFHYNLKVENSFKGLLQHFVNNRSVGLTTDMTIVCVLDN